ncbi:unnamed protein product [Durusdinium trenchii]|uniref:Uncharacterized protein n=2 Tax=Durusdinium trenchii TaxID=1381693 RepID=A0ABP0RGM9_9DINO
MASSAVCERELLFQKAELQRQQQALERQRLHEAEELRQGRETLRALAEEVSLRAAERFQEEDRLLQELKSSRQEIQLLSAQLVDTQALRAAARRRRAEAQVLRLRREVEELNAQVLAQERLAQVYEDSVAELHLELQHALDEAPAARRAAPARAASSAGRSSVALSRRLSSQLGVMRGGWKGLRW